MENKIKKQRKKIISSFIIFLAIIIGGIGIASYAVYDFFDSMCANEVFETNKSPDSKYNIILFQRDCGATTGFSTQISIIPMNKKLTNNGGNIFSTDGHPNENMIDINWLSPTKVVISNIPPQKRIYKKEKVFDNIEIVYSNR